jgi:hypothetical protein
VHVLIVCAKFGGDMRSPLPAYENLTPQILKRLTGRGSSKTSALAERRNGFVFAFLAKFAFESLTYGALHRGIPLGPILNPLRLG